MSNLSFYILAALGTALTQGMLAATGGLWAMMQTVWYGEFSNSHPLYRVFTGLPIVDQLLALSVTFWHPVIDGYPIARLQSILLCASLQTLAVWATIESMRANTTKPLILRWAPLAVFVWQYFGTAIFLPYYFIVELAHHFSPVQSRSDPSIPFGAARALLPAAILTVILPYKLVFFPSSGVTDSQLQIFIAQYQLGPFACYILVAGIAQYLSSPTTTNNNTPSQPPNADKPWIKATYLTFGAFSLLIHLPILIHTALTTDPTITLSRLLIPTFATLFRADAPANRYVEESLFFLQWDFILIVLGCGIYITRTMQAMHFKQGLSAVVQAGVILGSSAACVVLSPGAVVSGILYLREDYLRQDYLVNCEREEKE